MTYKSIALMFLLTAFISCRDEDEIISTESIDTSDWTEATHSKDVPPNYDVVFDQENILRFDITISAEDWQDMQNDLDTNLGSTAGPGMGGPGGGGAPAETDFDPIWVPCSFRFNDIEWYKVGIRYKGNSSLMTAHQSGTNKYSLKLDFDQFEDTYPDIKNQRFYGFKQLNLNNNAKDESFMREKVASDLFREFGLPSAQTSFCVIYLDYGSGPEYMGIYTIVEEVDDTVIETQFANGDGNLYKPDGTAASFAAGTFNTSEMEKKTNEEEDYSDVESLYDIINSDIRTSDEEAWKQQLNAVFDVDHFTKWLAANTAMQNWDTYGKMTHNYYLYNDSGVLKWIPWDNNEALKDGNMGGALSLSLDEVSSDWPLIRYIMDIDEYEQSYKAYLDEFTSNHFTPATMISIYEDHASLLQPYTSDDPWDVDFEGAVQELKQHVADRNTEINAFLN